MFSLLLCFGNCQIKVLAMLINNNRPGAYTLLNWNEWLTNVGHSLNLVLKRCKLKVETIYHFSFNEKESVSFDPTTKFLPKKFVEAVASFRLIVGTGLSLFTLKGEPPHKVNIHPSWWRCTIPTRGCTVYVFKMKADLIHMEPLERSIFQSMAHDSQMEYTLPDDGVSSPQRVHLFALGRPPHTVNILSHECAPFPQRMHIIKLKFRFCRKKKRTQTSSLSMFLSF